MKIEIKFKAWDEELEEWFYSDKPDDVHFFEFVDGTLKGFAIRPPKSSSDPMEPPEPYCDEYNPLEFTGLLKNGKGDEIYDKDIIGTPNGILYEVVWRPVYGQWWTKFWNTAHKGKWNAPLMKIAANGYLSIKGNIHDNETSESMFGASPTSRGWRPGGFG